MRKLALVFGLIDRSVGGGIDDQIGGERIEHGGDAVRAAEIERASVRGYDGAKGAEGLSQCLSNLAAHACQQNAHHAGS